MRAGIAGTPASLLGRAFSCTLKPEAAEILGTPLQGSEMVGSIIGLVFDESIQALVLLTSFGENNILSFVLDENGEGTWQVTNEGGELPIEFTLL